MLGSPSLRRPRGLMTPRGPGVLGVLLLLTLGAMLYWGRARGPEVEEALERSAVRSPAPPERAYDAGIERSPPHENKY